MTDSSWAADLDAWLPMLSARPDPQVWHGPRGGDLSLAFFEWPAL